jgi:flagellar export protein FliJ
MKRFSFRLQTLLDVAAQRERAAQQELMQSQSARNQALRRLDATLRRLAEWDQRIRADRRGAIDPRQLHDRLTEANAVARLAEAERQAHRAAETEVAAASLRLQEASVARKTVERLRDQAREEHDREVQARQSKLTDDLSSVRVAGDRAQGKTHPVAAGAAT